MMEPLARRLRHQGYRTFNWGYRSLFGDIRRHAEVLRAELAKLQQSAQIAKIHIVAHSMGSLIVRQALLAESFDKLGRIVLLCPPNQGSHVASRFVGALGWLSQPLIQISDRPDSFANRLPKTLAAHHEVGIILATRDFVVRHESSSLPFVEHTTIVSGFHSSILFKQQTAQLVNDFLKRGEF